MKKVTDIQNGILWYISSGLVGSESFNFGSLRSLYKKGLIESDTYGERMLSSDGAPRKPFAVSLTRSGWHHLQKQKK